MKKEFHYDRYVEANEDLARWVADDERLLQHYINNGRLEGRGLAEWGGYFNIEGIDICDAGFLVVRGWINRSVFRVIRAVISVGYYDVHVDENDFVFYPRSDVELVTQNTQFNSSFICMLNIGAEAVHPVISVSLNGKLVKPPVSTIIMSADQFLTSVLNFIAHISANTLSSVFHAGLALLKPTGELWRAYKSGIKFRLICDCRAVSEPNVSVIIVCYRNTKYLLPQLILFAEIFSAMRCEVIVVLNEVSEFDSIVDRLHAFSFLHKVEISAYVSNANSGFSAANNFGVSVARSETIILMNPDIFPIAHDIESASRMFVPAEANSLVGAMLFYGNGALMHSGMYVVKDVVPDYKDVGLGDIMRVEHFGKGELFHTRSLPSQMARGQKRYPTLASAAFWRIGKDEYVSNGGLPEDYIFAYYEDADFCLRFLENGGTISVDSDSRLYHFEAAGRTLPPSMRAASWLNRLRFSRKFSQSDIVYDGFSECSST